MKNTDLYTSTERIGSRWFGVVRLPWRQRHYVQEKGKPKPYDTQAEAAQAAADVVCAIFRDPTTGFVSQPLNQARSEAEALFKKPGS